MDFVLGQLGQLGMVVIIMACATGGTVGLLKLIKRFSPGKKISKDTVSKKPEESGIRDKRDEK